MKDEEVDFEGFIENYKPVKETGLTGLQVLADIRCVLSNFYNAKLVYDENGLNVKFKNGQSFTVTVKEKK